MNGRDIVFSSMGTTSHPVIGMQLDYLQIWENGHEHNYEAVVTEPGGYTTYICTCGDSYVNDYEADGEKLDESGNVYWVIGELTATEYDKRLTYRYKKLVFDNVDISLDEIGTPYWIRLEIRVNGSDGEKVYMVPIFENNEKFSTFKDYKLSAKEKP